MSNSSDHKFALIFEPRRPLLNGCLRPLLENLLVASSSPEKAKERPDPSTYLWVDFPAGATDKAINDAGLDRNVLLQQSVYPMVHFPLTQDLKEAIAKVSIYEPHGNNVYLNLSESGALWLKYQHSIGSQKLSEDNPDFIKKLTQQLSRVLSNGHDCSNSVERFQTAAEIGHDVVVGKSARIDVLLSDIGVVMKSIDVALEPKSNAVPSSAPATSLSVAGIHSSADKAPVIERALSARAAVSRRSSNASEAVLADLSKLFVDPATPQHLKLPAEHLANYAKIKALVSTAGGKYNNKGYFSFPEGIDPVAVQQLLLGGSVVNDKKDFQFFATPRAEATDLCDRAGPLQGKRVLEPSAGDGALADIARERGADVVVIENWGVNVSKLKAKGYDVIEKDFLQVTPEDIGLFDVILANPPFSKNQDIDHVRHMMGFLEPGGVLSVITSQAWERGTQKKQLAFAEFLKEIGAEVVPVAAGAFKESGTDVPTFKIVIEKPFEPELGLKSRSTSPRP